jgi:hypothetical protein
VAENPIQLAQTFLLGLASGTVDLTPSVRQRAGELSLELEPYRDEVALLHSTLEKIQTVIRLVEEKIHDDQDQGET